MQLTRREFAAGSLGVLAGLAWRGVGSSSGWGGLAAIAQDGRTENYFDWKPLADGVWVATKAGGNALIARSGGVCALIDTKNCGWGDTLRREVTSLGGDIEVVINTHHHGDHTGGNPSFKKHTTILAHGKAGARVIAHAEQSLAGLARLAKQLATDPQDAPPEAVAEVQALAEQAATIKPLDFASTVPLAEFAEIAVGKLTVRMQHKGAGHTDNDVYVFLPQHNLLHTGDLVFHKLHPYMDVGAGANSRGWQQSIRAMIDICDDKTIVVPGHGEVTDVQGLRDQSAYFDSLRELVGAARDKGAKREEVMALQPEAFANFGHERLQSANLGVIFDEMEKEAEG